MTKLELTFAVIVKVVLPTVPVGFRAVLSSINDITTGMLCGDVANNNVLISVNTPDTGSTANAG